MREILFRGKIIELCEYQGQWLEGFYGVENAKSFIAIPKENGLNGFYCDTETVGEYTGLTDKNGKKVFEGDICKAYICRADTVEKEVIGTICFEDGTFEFKCEHDSVYIYPLLEVLEVIGNIHDNPELMGGV